MEQLTCKSCGGEVTRSGNFYVCEYCGNRWQIDSADDVHAVDRANAWAALRDGDFEKAVSAFENIILKDGKNHEAYWGRALANAGIVYVTDLSENKKVPTCNNITEASFLKDTDVQKAIALAPEEIADSYRKQAEQIERIRREWLDKASKEPAYDVFISFKDSDREHGIERTQDSIDAQDLYNLLVNEGYKVFFSRISLHDKIAEQYEPYIYNALKTAKVMIVFGEKAEYFNAVWVKNEWSRFKTRIEKGEKHRNSLVVVYKNMIPADLPAVLKSRQCMNASDMSFSTDLMRHIRRVVEESKGAERLDKIAVTGGQIAKVASTIRTETLQTRDIGTGAIAETSISEQQSLSLTRTYLEMRQWEQAEKNADDLLFDNPGLGEAVWYKLLAQTKSANANELVAGKMNGLPEQSHGALEKALNCATKQFSEPLLKELYDACCDAAAATADEVLGIILPFNFADRQTCINKVFDSVTDKSQYQPFVRLLGTLPQDAVQEFISRNLAYTKASGSEKENTECFDRVLSVDAGNLEALHGKLQLALAKDAPQQETVQAFETLLKYVPDVNAEVKDTLRELCGMPLTAEKTAFAKQVIRYHSEGVGAMKQELLPLATALRTAGNFADAEYFLRLLLAEDKNNANVYWELCLAKAGVADESKLEQSKTMLNDLPEFNKYLTLVDEKRRKDCINLAAKQKAYKESLPKELAALKQDLKNGEKSNRMMGIGSVLAILGFIGGLILAIANDIDSFLSVLIIFAFIAPGAFLAYKGALIEGAKSPSATKARIEELEKLLQDDK